MKLKGHRNGKIMSAISMIENVNNETYKVQRLVEYFNGLQEMERAYGWGMKWVQGKNRGWAHLFETFILKINNSIPMFR